MRVRRETISVFSSFFFSISAIYHIVGDLEKKIEERKEENTGGIFFGGDIFDY